MRKDEIVRIAFFEMEKASEKMEDICTSTTMQTVKYFYSWRLDKNDPTPVGKKYELSLREKVRKMEEYRFAGILSGAGKTTVLELVGSMFL